MRVSDPLEKLVGCSSATQTVRQRVRRVAQSYIAVLILGESGTGKELVAQAIGELSGRRPFVAVNCAAIPEHLAESELFGHERGAFTGAVQARGGLVEEANGGTLFLDEFGELPGAVQAKLLRTLETAEYRRVGSTDTRRSDFRILAATSDDVDGEPGASHVRLALLHRVAAARIWLSPLRERPEDIPLLAEEFLRRGRARTGFGPGAITPQACGLLMAEPWPGNVRQLRNVVELAAAWAGAAPVLDFVAVLEALEMQRKPSTASGETLPTLAEARRRAERHAILDALRHTGGNRERAAKLLRVSQATLYRKLANGSGQLDDADPRTNASQASGDASQV